MLIAIPSEAPGGLDAPISEHFGHCEVFTLVEVEGADIGAVTLVPNQAHEHGGCMGPVNLLKDHGAEALVAGGMGMRPLSGFQDVGIAVHFKEGASTVREAAALFAAGECREFGADRTCGGQDGCGSHGHEQHEQIVRELVDGPVEHDRVVRLSYRLSDEDGAQIDTADGIHYLHGHGQIVPGLEGAIEGHAAGDAFQVVVQPQQGFGDHDPTRVIEAPLEDLPAGVKPGDVLQARLQNGGVMPLEVISIDGPKATLDGNHPLAGKTIVFDVEVIAVEAATAEDLARGHVH